MSPSSGSRYQTNLWWSSGNRHVLREQRYRPNLKACSTSRTTGLGSPNPFAISRELLHCSRYTAVITSYSLAGFLAVHGRTALTDGVAATHPVSRKRCCNQQNILSFGCRTPGSGRVHSIASLPAWSLYAPRVKSMSQHSSCVYSMIIRSQLTLSLTVSRLLITSSWQGNTVEKTITTLFDSDAQLKT